MNPKRRGDGLDVRGIVRGVWRGAASGGHRVADDGRGRIVTDLRSEKSVLVTGGAGYVGSHVVLALREAGYRVTVIDDLSSGRRDSVPGDVPLVRADIGDGRALRSTLREHAVGAVMHLAARVGVAESLSEPGGASSGQRRGDGGVGRCGGRLRRALRGVFVDGGGVRGAAGGAGGGGRAARLAAVLAGESPVGVILSLTP